MGKRKAVAGSSVTKTADDSNTILKLNDDCLLALFEYFDLYDLCAVAEVCRRFQDVAKYTFSHSKRTELKVPEDLMRSTQRYTVRSVFSKTSSVLRNFGQFITEIHGSSYKWAGAWQSDFEREFIRLLLQNCRGNLITLELKGFNLTADVVQGLRPFFDGLRKFAISFSAEMPELSPSWFPELRELEFSDIGYNNRGYNPNIDVDMMERSDSADESYQNLERVVLRRVRELKNQDVEKILKCSSKLKELEIDDQICCDVNGAFFFEAIAKHTPAIEKLDVSIKFEESIHENINCSSAFQNLSSLTCRLDFLAEERYSDHLVLTIRDIAVVGIPLKYLHLKGLCMDENAPTHRTFVDAVAKFKKLETLVLEDCDDLDASDIIEICKSLKQMIVFQFYSDVLDLSAEDILTIVKNSENLERLELIGTSIHEVVADDRIDFDIDTFNKFVGKRLNKKPLHIELDLRYYNVSSPNN